MRNLLIASMMVIGAALPVMAREIEVPYAHISSVRNHSKEGSFARVHATDDRIKTDLTNYCQGMYESGSEKVMLNAIVSIGSDMEEPAKQEFYRYMSVVGSVAEVLTCPDAFR